MSHQHAERITSGFDALDDLLPSGGFLPGQLVEWLVESPGSGGSTLALTVARAAIQPSQKTLIVVDRPESRDHGAAFYPPAAAGLGISLRQLIILRPHTVADEMWALDQVFRCPCVGAVWAWLPQLNDRNFRRLQLAAEEGGGLGLLMRPARLRGQPTWADIQLLVETRPSPESIAPLSANTANQPVTNHNPRDSRLPTGDSRRRRWLVTLLRCRGGTAGEHQLLELDETNGTLHKIKATYRDPNSAATSSKGAPRDEKSPLPLATQLAHPTNRSKQNRNSA